MQNMLGPVEKNSKFKKTGTMDKDDFDRLEMRDIHRSSFSGDWVPGKRRMSDQDHEAIIHV